MGRSAVAAAAYRSGACLVDDRLAMEFNFAAKDAIEHAEILLPANAPAAYQDRAVLWNAAENSEARKDAVPARELLVSLPHELSFLQRRELVRDFVSEHLVSRGMVADLAMHKPGKEGDERNFHAHILVTTRDVGPGGFKRKNTEWRTPGALREWREEWAEVHPFDVVVVGDEVLAQSDQSALAVALTPDSATETGRRLVKAARVARRAQLPKSA